MEKDQEQLEALQDIRKMMKESSKFLSLSGLSGIIAGIYALIGAGAVYQLLQLHLHDGYDGEMDSRLTLQISAISITVLLLSIATAYFLSGKKAKKLHQRLFDHTSKKVLWSMAVPLGAGGIFCLSLLYHHFTFMLPSVMLIFYGLALFSSSKFTLPEIKYLGILQTGLGLLASFIPGQGLLLWALGFGVLHIIYGAIVWNKYERHI
jgi:hypothetical protein